MKRAVKKDNIINIFCEFTDNNLEIDFIEYDMGKTIKFVKPIILVLGVLYLFFTIPDYFLIKNMKIFIGILINRSIVFFLMLVLYFRIKKIKKYTKLIWLLTLYKLLILISYLIIFYQYENPDYLIQAIGIMVLMIGFNMIPNKWINIAMVSVISCMAFLMVAYTVVRPMKMEELFAGIAYLIIVLLLCSISSYRTNYLKRRQFYDSKELLRMSTTDALTGIYNRGKFDTEFKYWVDYSKRYKIPLSLVIFDFDEFKNINDRYGHLVGDDVIVQSVSLISNSIRGTDIFARWGGEEFVLLLTNTENTLAIEITERIRKTIAEYNFETVGRVTCSFGVVTLDDEDFPITLLNKADQRLYFAKTLGKNRVAC